MNTLSSIGYSNKIESPDDMRKIIHTFPPRLQANQILNAEQREICIEDISNFVKKMSRSLGNPIFGKLPCMEKKPPLTKQRGWNPEMTSLVQRN